MGDSSSAHPNSRFSHRALPPWTTDGSADLKNSLLATNSVRRAPTARPKRVLVFAALFASVFIVSTMIFLFGNNSSAWLKSMLRDRLNHVPHFLFPDDAAAGAYFLPPVNVSSSEASKDEERKPSVTEKKKAWLERMNRCDIFDGRWVKTDLPPLYERGSCDLMDPSFNCYRNGRMDNEYEKYRWQPNECNIPRLDGRRLLKFMRGKKMVFVGDSLGRNMWESLVCLLRNSVKDKSRVFEASGSVDLKKEGAYAFIFLDYNASIEYVRSSFLIHEMKNPNGKKGRLKLDVMDKNVAKIRDADMLVFHTGSWWTHTKIFAGENYYQEGNYVHPKLDVITAFHKAKKTWTKWIETKTDPNKTQIFFTSFSFNHFSKEWNSGGTCNEKTPITNDTELLSVDQMYPPIARMLDNVVLEGPLKDRITYLNITKMTNYRRDAHPSLYRQPNVTKKEKEYFLNHQDCSHWCLPGLPETWNQLMFTKLLVNHKQKKWSQEIGLKSLNTGQSQNI